MNNKQEDPRLSPEVVFEIDGELCIAHAYLTYIKGRQNEV